MLSSNNLPEQLTSFVGREHEIAEVKRLLASTRLLTITGTGGAGKTRLSLKIASDLLHDYPDGVWFVDLSVLEDPSLVPQAVASTLGVREEQGHPLVDTLARYIQPLCVLIIFDNCEHLMEASSALADT